MRHHKKSNNGRFSKKQKKASRIMMANRRGAQPRGESLSMPAEIEKGFIAGLLSTIFRRKARP